MLHASIVVIGDEILDGYVQDTNSGWLTEQLRDHGVRTTRVHVVPDDAGLIDEALQAELARPRPRLVLTSGGLGSTPDDITFAAVAASLGRELVEHPALARRVGEAIEWTRGLGVTVDEEYVDHMMRMARVPEGARLLERAGSYIPGVRVDVDGGLDDGGVTVVILPGVPAHLQRIVSQEVLPDLVAGRNPRPTVVEITHDLPESALNTSFARVRRELPDVRVGSYPGTPTVVRLSGDATDVAAAAEILRDHLAGLARAPGTGELSSAWAEEFADGNPNTPS